MVNLFRHIRLKENIDIEKIVQNSDINILNEFGQNLLHEAIAFDNSDAASLLIKLGINLNKKDKNGQAPLHFAAAYNNYEITQRILEKGADVNIRDIYGNNPLWTAVFNARGNNTLVKLLMSYGGNPNNVNNANKSPLDFAKQINSIALLEILNTKS